MNQEKGRNPGRKELRKEGESNQGDPPKNLKNSQNWTPNRGRLRKHKNSQGFIKAKSLENCLEGERLTSLSIMKKEALWPRP